LYRQKTQQNSYIPATETVVVDDMVMRDSMITEHFEPEDQTMMSEQYNVVEDTNTRESSIIEDFEFRGLDKEFNVHVENV